MVKQFLIFASCGVIGTGAHYTVLIILVELFSADVVAASTVGFICGAAVNYVLNYKITFKSQKRHFEAFVKFFSVALVGAGLNALIMDLGRDHLPLNYLFVQLLATGLVLFWNYGANRLWTFRVAP